MKRVSARRWNERSPGCRSAPGISERSRHGTITLFAALNYLDGKIISRTEPSHTHVEWLRFLKQLDRETPGDIDLHLIIDNYATHKHFFADITQDAIRGGSFTSVRQLIAAIEEYLALRNLEPKRYLWKAKGEEILAKIHRAQHSSRLLKKSPKHLEWHLLSPASY